MTPDGTPVELQVARRLDRPRFPSYLQLPIRVPIGAWQAARVVTLTGALGLCVVLQTSPDTGLKLMWKVLVPLLPIVWFTFPGLWRNVCPLAASNQTSRVLGLTRGRTLPPWLARNAFTIGVAAFFVLVPARKVLFNRSGTATAVLLLGVLALAFVGGFVFKGKSGWCSTMCPLLPVQRLYGETPVVLVRNSHCEPCLGCAKNCFDFNPLVAKLADLHDDDPRYVAPRRLFAAAFPGLVLGFFSMPDLPAESTAWVYGRIGLFVAVSIAITTVADTFLPVSAHKQTAVAAAFALNAFYWYSVPTLVDTIGDAPSAAVRDAAIWSGRAVVLGLTIAWLVRTFAKEAPFLAASEGAAAVPAAGLEVLRGGDASPTVTFHPDGPEIDVVPGTPLLEVIESAGLPIESGCRLGVCGADPITIVDGGDALSAAAGDEITTLDRLGLGEQTRLACQARVHGACVVTLGTTAATRPARPLVAAAAIPEARRVVILGNGIAGASAADHARRCNPDGEIHVVGMEPHRLYNRMAISRLIHGRSAMQGLYLLPDSWYDDHRVTCWLNTRARSIDLAERVVVLATGDVLPYDRLIVATGSRSVVPEMPGVGLRGSFTLRVAEDAIAMRALVQEHDVRAAVISGAGLLGLEAAYALRKLGVEVAVLEWGSSILRRQLDEAGGRVLQRYLEALGISILTDAEATEVQGDQRVTGVALADGRELACGLFLACRGTVPNAELAVEAGLTVRDGIVVDDRMRTSHPDVYAAGDVAALDGEVAGFWPQSARQGEIAGVNAAGGDARYEPSPCPTILKVAGVDLASIGEVSVSPGDEVVALEEDELRYRRLLIRDGCVVGAILLGHSHVLAGVERAMREAVDLSDALDALRAGNWSALDPELAGTRR